MEKIEHYKYRITRFKRIYMVKKRQLVSFFRAYWTIFFATILKNSDREYCSRRRFAWSRRNGAQYMGRVWSVQLRDWRFQGCFFGLGVVSPFFPVLNTLLGVKSCRESSASIFFRRIGSCFSGTSTAESFALKGNRARGFSLVGTNPEGSWTYSGNSWSEGISSSGSWFYRTFFVDSWS